MLLKATESTTQEHCDAFFTWLVDAGVTGSHMSALVLAVAKKVDTMFPGIFDEAQCKLKGDA